MKKLIRGLGSFIAIAGALLGLVLSLLVLYEIAGAMGILLGLVFFPLTWAYIPLYKLFVSHSWNLVFINYGSIATALFLYSLADNMEKQPRAATDEPPTQPVVTKTLMDYLVPIAILLVIGGLVLAAVISALK